MNNLENVLMFLFIGLIAGWLAGVFVKRRGFGVLVPLLLASFAAAAQASTTTVTVDDGKVAVVPQAVSSVSTPVVITREAAAGDFQGRIVEIDFALSQILINDTAGLDRIVSVKPETINGYRVGDYVYVRPTAELTVVTLEEENPRNFEGEIIRIALSENQIVVQDTNGRERRVQLKQGMIGTYKVDDYVRVHLMADLKEAKTVETVRDVRSLDGTIVNVDASTSRIVLRDTHGKDSTVIVRQGQVVNYRTGDHVRVYLLPNREQVQVIRVIR